MELLRNNKHFIISHVRCFSKCKSLKPFWVDALSITNFSINDMPFTVLNGDIRYSIFFALPNKPLFPIEPSVFGITCYVRDISPHIIKLDPKALKCFFLGYQKSYWWLLSSTYRYMVYTDMVFSKNILFFFLLSHFSKSAEYERMAHLQDHFTKCRTTDGSGCFF